MGAEKRKTLPIGEMTGVPAATVTIVQLPFPITHGCITTIILRCDPHVRLAASPSRVNGAVSLARDRHHFVKDYTNGEAD